MENYYFDLSRLPEKFSNDTVKKFMEQHKFNVYEPSKAPKNKHIGSGAWHDDVIAFLEENAPVETTPEVEFFSKQEKEYIESTISTLAEDIVVKVLETTPIQVQMVHGNKKRGFVIENLSVFADTLKIEVAEIKLQPEPKKKAAKKVAEVPNPTDNNGVA